MSRPNLHAGNIRGYKLVDAKPQEDEGQTVTQNCSADPIEAALPNWIKHGLLLCFAAPSLRQSGGRRRLLQELDDVFGIRPIAIIGVGPGVSDFAILAEDVRR